MDAIEVGKRVKQYRENAGLTQNALATRAGVAPSYIPDIEKGKKCPTVQTLGYICFGLGITLAEFFRDSDEQKELNSTIQNLTARLSSKQQTMLLDFLKTI
ncbi:MAG: helix-turn-helix transcriptional regulator [Clostridia bacterium]|jgi:transcriptional regulator with XRE-family HTH domain|nr:helix-turn-helix transcriptional regulator [Clostridia bacterium]